MKLTITGRHAEVSKDIQQYIRKRFQKWNTFLPSQTEVHVIVNVEGYRHTVEVSASSGRYTIAARQTTKDIRSSVDLLAEKVGRQLARQHERLLPKAGKPTARKMDVLTDSVRERREALPAGRIVESKPWASKPMTREEAALQLQSLRQPFMIFEDVDTGQLAVLTRRADGNFTLITKD